MNHLTGMGRYCSRSRSLAKDWIYRLAGMAGMARTGTPMYRYCVQRDRDNNCLPCRFGEVFSGSGLKRLSSCLGRKWDCKQMTYKRHEGWSGVNTNVISIAYNSNFRDIRKKREQVHTSVKLIGFENTTLWDRQFKAFEWATRSLEQDGEVVLGYLLIHLSKFPLTPSWLGMFSLFAMSKAIEIDVRYNTAGWAASVKLYRTLVLPSMRQKTIQSRWKFGLQATQMTDEELCSSTLMRQEERKTNQNGETCQFGMETAVLKSLVWDT